MNTIEKFLQLLLTFFLGFYAIAFLMQRSSDIVLTKAINAKERDRGCIYLPPGEKMPYISGMQIKDIDFKSDPKDPCFDSKQTVESDGSDFIPTNAELVHRLANPN